MSAYPAKVVLSKLERTLEAILLISAEPVYSKDLTGLFVDKAQDIESSFKSLQSHYVEGGHGLRILRLSGGWQLVSSGDLSEKLEEFTDIVKRKKVRLSKAAMECLAVAAYNQPVTRSEIEEIRGVRCDRVLDTLLSHKLIHIAGRGKGTGSPLLYRTTDEFLQLFGLNSISELPTLEELKEISNEDPDEDIEGYGNETTQYK